MLTVVVFLILLSILVLVHEFGHFIVGKMAGIGVVEFALGLPFTKPLWSKKLKSGMKLSFYPVLFGGFVKLLGEEGPIVSPEEREQRVNGIEFYKANVWVRVAVVVAGVAMNVVLGIVAFYLFLTLSNFRTLVPRLADYNFVSPSQPAVVILAVEKGSPAEAAGIKADDVVLSADGESFAKLADFQGYIKSRAGSEVDLSLTNLDFGKFEERRIVPRVNPPAGQGALGVGIGPAIAIMFDSPAQRLTSGVTFSYDMLFYNLKVLSGLVMQSFKTHSAAPVADNISGPVGIAKTVGDILGIGGFDALKALVNFLGLLSLSLAFMNILPVPAMDGGRLAFLLIEAVTTKKLASKYENYINQAGMIFLLALIVLISFNDVKRNFLPECGKNKIFDEIGVCNSTEMP